MVMCSNLLSRTTREAQHKHDEQAEKVHHEPDETAQHHEGESQRRGAAETGAVTPERGELPTQASGKNCLESFALSTLLETDSLLHGLDGNDDFADEASKQSGSNHQRESVPLVSSCIETGGCSTAEDVAELSPGTRSQILECMMWLHGVCDSVSTHQMLNREEKPLLGGWYMHRGSRVVILQSSVRKGFVFGTFATLTLLSILMLYIRVCHDSSHHFRILLQLLAFYFVGSPEKSLRLMHR